RFPSAPGACARNDGSGGTAMVANPNSGIPAAFRGRRPARPGFIGLTDDEVLKIAAGALRMVQALPFGSAARTGQWDSFEHAMAALSSRDATDTLRRLYESHEREQDGEEQ